MAEPKRSGFSSPMGRLPQTMRPPGPAPVPLSPDQVAPVALAAPQTVQRARLVCRWLLVCMAVLRAEVERWARRSRVQVLWRRDWSGLVFWKGSGSKIVSLEGSLPVSLQFPCAFSDTSRPSLARETRRY